MEKAGEPVDYLSAMERMRREEQNKKSQIRSPDFFPQELNSHLYFNVL